MRTNPTHEWSQHALLSARHRTFASPDNHFSRCSKQVENGFIRENDFSAASVLWDISQSFRLFPGDTWLLCPSSHHPPKAFIPQSEQTPTSITFKRWSCHLLDYPEPPKAFFTVEPLCMKVLMIRCVVDLDLMSIVLLMQSRENCMHFLAGNQGQKTKHPIIMPELPLKRDPKADGCASHYTLKCSSNQK